MKQRKKKENRTAQRAARRAVSLPFRLHEGVLEARGVLCEERVTLLAYQLTLPAAPMGEGVSSRAAARIAAFYARIAKGIWRECEGDLFPRVRCAYEESDDTLKRFRFARFVLSAEWHLLEEDKGSLTVARTLTLSRRGKVLRHGEWREVFSKKSGRPVFPLSERILSALAPSWRRKNKQKCEQENKQRCKQESKQKEG